MALKFLHIILAFNVLLSSMGVTMFEHLCQMKGKEVAFFEKPQNCCQKKTEASDNCTKSKCCQKPKNNSGTTISKKPCCEDRAQYFKADTDGTLAKSSSAPDFKFQPLAIVAVWLVERPDIIPLSQKILRFYLYKPPPNVTDIRVLIQSFLC